MVYKEAARLYLDKDVPLTYLLWKANKTREAFKKNKVELCSIVNAKSGMCPEDCRFCAQSSRYNTKIDRYPLIGSPEILKAAASSKSSIAPRDSARSRCRSLRELSRAIDAQST